VIDDTLDDDDLRVSVAATVNGRTVRFVNVKFDRTMYGQHNLITVAFSSVIWITCSRKFTRRSG
jgi:hypothetical protein